MSAIFLAAALSAAAVVVARADGATMACDAPADLTRLDNPLSHVAQRVARGEPIKIVAIGSSSTAGAGASAPDKTYPARLQAELSKIFPRNTITVINRGVGGEEIADMLKRFDAAVVAEKPDLVLWQLGTNSVLRDHKVKGHDTGIHIGLEKVRATGADVILIDPQFAPKVIVKPEAHAMVELIAATAKRENVDLFRRFAVMRRWHDVDHMMYESFVSPDGLHMNDWSYDCIAKGLGAAIAEAAQRPVLSATATPVRAPAKR